jgi:peptidoglycan/xylan/chitin deacetylase (PgdA/CDA1 family)
MRIAISFDYDSPAGYRESFTKRDYNPDADFVGTERLLRVLAEHDVKASFAVVGRVALPGQPPDHCPQQIREIAAAGHEIASHSMLHRFIPSMRTDELIEDLRGSKEALESCLGQPIRGFVPPFNRPSHFPQKGAFSLSELFGHHGRGRSRQSLSDLLRALCTVGFGWARVSFQNSLEALSHAVGVTRRHVPAQPFIFNGIVAIPLHLTGFGQGASELVQRHIDDDILLTLYAHPNQALHPAAVDSESAEALSAFLASTEKLRLKGKLHFQTLKEAELTCKQATSPALGGVSTKAG